MAKSGIHSYKYSTKTHKMERVELSSRDVKQYVMRVHGWTSEEYNKKYDLFKNKLRAYESFKKAHGANIVPQSVAQVLYKEARAMQREGADYKPSIKMRQIQSFSAVSITKGRQRAKATSGRAYERSLSIIKKGTLDAFSDLIAHDPKAAEMAERIKDPVKLEKALSEYAERMHAVRSAEGKVTSTQAIPFGERVGSPDSIDFDYGEYLDEEGEE